MQAQLFCGRAGQALLLNGFMGVGADLSSHSQKSWIYPHSTTSRTGTQII